MLRTFITVAELKSVTGAARALRLAQSAVSMQMSTLARMTGLSLVERHRGELTLTREGREFYEAARKIVHSVAAMRDVVARAQETAQLSLAMVSSRGAANVLMGNAAARFLRENPHVRVTARNIATAAALAMLSTGEVDCAFVSEVPHSPFSFRPLANDCIRLVLHPDAPLARAPVVRPCDLVDVPFALQPRLEIARRIVEESLGTSTARLNVVAELDSTAAILRCVETGTFASFAPASLVAAAVERGTIVLRDVEGVELRRTIGIATDPGRPAEPGLECFLTWLETEFGSHP